ncbi:MAG: TolC family protein [Candidatus Binatia bacterium]
MRRTLIIAIAIATGLGTPAANAEEKKTLAECIAIAVAQHPSLKAADASVQAGHERVFEATTAYLPQLSATYQATRRQTNPAAFGIPGSSTRSNFYQAGAALTQILFDWGQNLDAIRAAQASEQSLRADRSTQTDAVVLGVKQAYFNVLATRRLLGVADETVRQNQKHLEQAQARFGVGLAAKFDVTQAQVQLAQAELNQVTARNNVAVAHETLRNALGLAGPLDFDIVDNLDVHAVQMTEEAALSAAYDKRPELQSIHAQQLATTQQIKSFEKTYLPSLQANGNYNYLGVDYPLHDTWTASGVVTFKFDGGLALTQAAEQKANLANLKYNEEVERQNIALEVRQDVLNLQQATESIRVSDKGLQLARENLELAEGRYNTGVGNIIELTDAQASRTTAEANYVQALYNYKTALAALEKATAQSLATD